ncbi:MAG: hypothetical protein QOF13_2132 [Solirubrobacterales bacterium]|jgi:hypothetical protein|nr:hypothetical protein [Solirubrobacterales bacterium]
MAAIQLAKNVWILCVGGLVAVVVILLIAGSIFGCGSSLRETCPGINWEGRQCQAIKNIESLEAQGLPAHLAEGYYSLPEDER